MTVARFDPRLIDLYKEPRLLLHFQWGRDNKIYRYALVETMEVPEITQKTKQHLPKKKAKERVKTIVEKKESQIEDLNIDDINKKFKKIIQLLDFKKQIKNSKSKS